MSIRTTLAVAVAAVIGLGAAAVAAGPWTDAGTGGGPPDRPSILGAPDGAVVAAGLEAPRSCDDLGATMRTLMEQHNGPSGVALGVGDTDEMATDDAGGRDTDATAASGEAEAAADLAAPTGGVDGDATNVQVEGVDEPDIVERVGDLVLVGTQGHLRIVTLDDDGQPVERGQLALGLWGEIELFAVADDRVVALVRDGDPRPVRGEAGDQPTASSPVLPPSGVTSVVLVDLADPDAPRELSRVDIEGWLVDGRAVDGVLRLAVRGEGPRLDPFALGEFEADREMDWETATEQDHRRYQQAFEAEYEQRMARLLDAVEGTDWQPHARVTHADGTSRVTPVVPCDRIALPTSYAGPGTLTLAAIDATGDTLAIDDATSIVTAGEQLYATADRVVVATTRWEPCCIEEPLPEPEPAPEEDPSFVPGGDEDADGAAAVAAVLPMVDIAPMPGPWGRGQTTDLHVFDVDGTLVSHVASGSVEGWLLNQFSMSIHDRVLRVATTAVDESDGRTESAVTTFRVDGDELVQLGHVDGLGPNEDIQSVRFMGEVGYVVTFRRTDPLYVVDLRDPAAPRTLGELKIEGYSAYLHPLGDDLLLGVGQDADPETGMVRGVQVSTFDVADPTSPTRVDVDVTPDSHTEVEWDHHALTVTAADRAFVPFEEYRDDGGQRLGVLVYDVAADGSLIEVGVLDAGSRWELRPRRTVVLDGALLTVGDGGVIGWDADTLQPTGTLTFPEPDWEALERELAGE